MVDTHPDDCKRRYARGLFVTLSSTPYSLLRIIDGRQVMLQSHSKSVRYLLHTKSCLYTLVIDYIDA